MTDIIFFQNVLYRAGDYWHPTDVHICVGQALPGPHHSLCGAVAVQHAKTPDERSSRVDFWSYAGENLQIRFYTKLEYVLETLLVKINFIRW